MYRVPIMPGVLRKGDSSLPKIALPNLSASCLFVSGLVCLDTVSRIRLTAVPPHEQAIGVRGTTHCSRLSSLSCRERGSARPLTPHRGGRGVPSTSPQRWRQAVRQGYKLVAPLTSTGIGTLYGDLYYCCSIGSGRARLFLYEGGSLFVPSS